MVSGNTTAWRWRHCLPVIAVALAGCSTVGSGRVIEHGDRVGVHFTCRLPNSAVAISSEKDLASDLPRAPFFLPRVGDDTLELVAGVGETDSGRSVQGFEDDVLKGIALALPGLRSGEQRTVDLLSSRGTNGEIRLARVRHAEKERQVPVEEFREHTKREPEMGQTVQFGDGLPGRVTKIEDGKVTIAFSGRDGDLVTTPLGSGKLLDVGKQFDIVIDARPGDLMRMGPLVGRIKSVDDNNIDLDFTKTFGGENLRCDLKVEGVQPGGSQTGSAAPTVTIGNTSPEQSLKGEAPSTDTQLGVELLQAAMADAVKSGKSTVNVDTDALLSRAARGDLVTVGFTARDAAGVSLDLPEGMDLQGKRLEIIAGKDELFPGLGAAVIGMAPGEKKQVTLTPEQAFGKHDETKTATYRIRNNYPATIKLPADEYVKLFGGFPAMGKEVPLASFVTAKVAEIGEKEVTLAVTAQDGARFDRPFGTVTTLVGKDGITLQLEPKLGAPFNEENRLGVITASNNETFTVDFNHPLAGKTIVLDLEAVGVTKASVLNTKPIDWIEDHEKGLSRASQGGKPAVLVLYADWCGFCKKLFSETIPDPRIEQLKDSFVWVKVNSDKELRYKKQYGQEGFPMLVLFKPDGSVAQKIDGFRDAATLSRILRELLKNDRTEQQATSNGKAG